MGRPAFSHRNEPESSLELLYRARQGDRAALEALFARYRPRLARWASGRLPAGARDLLDTDDLVQEALLRTFERVEAFEPRREGALQAYLRQAILNRIRDEVRKMVRRPATDAVGEDKSDPGPSPLEAAIGGELLERYEEALARLRPEDREAIIARVELGLPYAEVAEALGKPSIEAAQMAVSRALVRLAREMGDDG